MYGVEIAIPLLRRLTAELGHISETACVLYSFSVGTSAVRMSVIRTLREHVQLPMPLAIIRVFDHCTSYHLRVVQHHALCTVHTSRGPAEPHHYY